MVGGTTSGYSLIGSRNIAIKATMKIIVESNPAKMGRRMKKSEKFIIVFPRFPNYEICLALRRLDFRRLGRNRRFRAHLHTRADALNAIDDDLVPGLDS